MSSDDLITKALVRDVLVRLYDESLPRILQCLDQLTDDQIWWRPNASSNSVGNLVLHLSGNVTQWIYAGLGGYPDTRERQAEFDERRGLDKEALAELLQQTMQRIRPVIEGVDSEELMRRRKVQTFEENGVSILIHVTEHFSYHTGQIAYITKMLMDKPLGFYEGIKLV